VLNPLKDLKSLMWAVEVEFFPRYTFSPFSCLGKTFSFSIYYSLSLTLGCVQWLYWLEVLKYKFDDCISFYHDPHGNL